jgi:hypothetical protein
MPVFSRAKNQVGEQEHEKPVRAHGGRAGEERALRNFLPVVRLVHEGYERADGQWPEGVGEEEGPVPDHEADEDIGVQHIEESREVPCDGGPAFKSQMHEHAAEEYGGEQEELFQDIRRQEEGKASKGQLERKVGAVKALRSAIKAAVLEISEAAGPELHVKGQEIAWA